MQHSFQNAANHPTFISDDFQTADNHPRRVHITKFEPCSFL